MVVAQCVARLKLNGHLLTRFTREHINIHYEQVKREKAVGDIWVERRLEIGEKAKWERLGL